MEERQRVKIVDYVGSKKIETSKIEEKLKDANAEVRLDTFIDPGLVRKVEGIVRDMMKEKGFQFANVTHEIKPIPGGPKLVHLTFHIDEGPKVKIKSIDFIGNKAIGDGALRRQMKDNKEQWFFSFITGRGTYQEAKFDDDAEKIAEYYRDHGYIKARDRRAGAEVPRRFERQEDALGRPADSGRPKGSATRSATSRSRATRSSRPTT